jgi:hypothetical protein
MRWGMASFSHQSRDAEALRCCGTDGLAGITYSFMMTAITPVNIAYAFELTNFSSAAGPKTSPDCRSLCASRRVNRLQRSLSTA